MPDPEDLASAAVTVTTSGRWVTVCRVDEIIPNTGVCALVGKRQVAVVRVGEGNDVYALSNFDPFSKAMVISRGIVGDRQGVPKIASPIFKQSFDLRSGVCLDDPSVAVATFPLRIVDGVIEVFG
ncbi:MAG TPA: nitrite reductase small subunit NirD [Polyangia bacterium]